MKIVHVVYSLEMGGAEVLVAQLCRAQRSHGHDVSVCAYSSLGPLGEALRNDGVQVFVPGEASPAATIRRYYRHFSDIKPDVVHTHNPAPTLQAAMSAKLAGVRRVIATRHSLVAPPYDVAAELKFSAMAHFCDSVVGICEITCENLRGAPLAARGKIVRVYNGAAAIPPVEVPAEKRGFTVVFIGRLAEIKDLGTLLRAVAIAAESVPTMEAWIVGDGPVRPKLEALAAEVGIADRVRFWGQQMETARFYAAADVFAMSSVSEGLPMSLLQAMSAGVPAVTTDVGGMAEVLELSGAGLRAPVGDAAGLAACLVKLAENAELRAKLGERGRAAYAEHFTPEAMQQAYMQLYRGERIAGEGSSRGSM